MKAIGNTYYTTDPQRLTDLILSRGEGTATESNVRELEISKLLITHDAWAIALRAGEIKQLATRSYNQG